MRAQVGRLLALVVLVVFVLTLGLTSISEGASSTPLIPIEPPEIELQEIEFTTTPPSSASVGGPAYEAAATTNSGKSVAFSSGTPSVCSVVGTSVDHATVTFLAVGTCRVIAKATSSSFWTAAQEEQSFAVGKGSQAITFTSAPPSSATVGGPTYAVTATGGASGEPVIFSIGGASSSVCSISGSMVSFIGVGTCTIDANQAGNANYNPAPQVQQSFAVGPAPTGTEGTTGSGGTSAGGTAGTASPSGPGTSPTAFAPPITVIPPPNSNFSLLGKPTFNPRTGAISFKASDSDPGTLSWLLTFANGKFGAFQSSTTKCKAAQIRLGGRCRPARIVFGRGKEALSSAGIISFTVPPDASARAALKNALKKRRGLTVTAVLTFQSSRGGSPISHTQSIIDVLRRKP